MSIANRVKQLLDENGVEYEHITHEPVYTTQEVAQRTHTPGREVAKVVILTDGEEHVMAVLPATRKIDLDRLRHAAGNEGLRLASEAEFDNLFPNVETGAMAPFGNLYGMSVFVDQSLREDEEITFNAGTHQDAIRMAYSDFERLVEPVAAEFSQPIAAG